MYVEISNSREDLGGNRDLRPHPPIYARCPSFSNPVPHALQRKFHTGGPGLSPGAMGRVSRALQRFRSGFRRSLSSLSFSSRNSTRELGFDLGAEEEEQEESIGEFQDVPAGCLAVFVERTRFVVPVKLLNHILFKVLLESSRTEFGYRHPGALHIACSVDLFAQFLILMENKPKQELVKSIDRWQWSHSRYALE